VTDLTPKTYEDWLDEILAKLRSNIAGTSTGSASEARLRAEVIASLLEGQSLYIDWSLDQRFPDSANSDNLERHCAIYDLDRKDATGSEGEVTVTGTPGSTYSVGDAFTDAEGNAGELTAGGTIPGGGSVDVEAESTDTGVAVNWASGESFSFSAPGPGIDTACEAADDFTGGTDEETDAALLVRLLARIQYPPAGGTESDWYQWAMEVDGVHLAYTHPLRRGLGTIDVSIVTLGSNGHLDLPGGSLLSDVEDHLDDNRPVTTKDFEVLAPDQVLQNVTVDDLVVVDGYDSGAVEDAVEEAIPTYMDGLEPGDTLLVYGLIAAIMAVAGVESFTLTTPAADVTATLDSDTAELIMPNTITVNLA